MSGTAKIEALLGPKHWGDVEVKCPPTPEMWRLRDELEAMESNKPVSKWMADVINACTELGEDVSARLALRVDDPEIKELLDMCLDTLGLSKGDVEDEDDDPTS